MRINAKLIIGLLATAIAMMIGGITVSGDSGKMSNIVSQKSATESEADRIMSESRGKLDATDAPDELDTLSPEDDYADSLRFGVCPNPNKCARNLCEYPGYCRYPACMPHCP